MKCHLETSAIEHVIKRDFPRHFPNTKANSKLETCELSLNNTVIASQKTDAIAYNIMHTSECIKDAMKKADFDETGNNKSELCDVEMINIEHPRARRALNLAKKLSARRMSEFEDSPPSLTKSYPSISNIATGEVKHPRAQKALMTKHRHELLDFSLHMDVGLMKSP